MGIVDQPPSGSPVFSWIHTDRLGTPLAVTSTPASGPAQVIWRASYEPFGLAMPDEDPDGDSQSFALDLRFPGQVFDAESGGHYNYFRDYDAATGRYLESDPIGQAAGANTYAYAFANSLNSTDVLGLEGQATPRHPKAVPVPLKPTPVSAPVPDGPSDDTRGGGTMSDFVKDVVDKMMDRALDALGGGVGRTIGCEAHREACTLECGGDPDTNVQAINECVMRKFPECQAKNAGKLLKESIDKLNRR